MPTPFENKHLMLGVTGSIAAYKAIELASRLYQSGALVDTVVTKGASRFISPLNFRTITGRSTYSDPNLWDGSGHVLHVDLAQSLDLAVVAPATANTIAKLAHGVADNLLLLTVLAARCPLVIAPAMDAGLYDNLATQDNLKLLEERGVKIIGPDWGRLVSGAIGIGRMTEPEDIFNELRFILSRNGRMSGKKVVVTAGSTQEPVDPVWYIANRSSGKQGYAIAQAALDNGAEVVLITAPTALHSPAGARKIAVRTAAEMCQAVMAELDGCAALIMAAAVSDFRPEHASSQKIKKVAGVPQLTLESTTDILSAVAEYQMKTGSPSRLIGFADETENILENAYAKLTAKNLDMIVANDVSGPEASYDAPTSRVTLVYADGRSEELPILTKELVAENLIHKIETWLNE